MRIQKKQGQQKNAIPSFAIRKWVNLHEQQLAATCRHISSDHKSNRLREIHSRNGFQNSAEVILPQSEEAA